MPKGTGGGFLKTTHPAMKPVKEKRSVFDQSYPKKR